MRILLLGDLILDEPGPDALFDPSRELLRSADVLVGQVEVPHSRRGTVQSTDVPARPSDPDNLAALERVGLDVATLAGNHIADAGREGIEDTIAGLQALGIATTGAGMSLAEARVPALVSADGRRSRSPTIWCITGSNAAIFAGLKYGLSARRYGVCSGGSRWSGGRRPVNAIFGTTFCTVVVKRAGSDATATTSS